MRTPRSYRSFLFNIACFLFLCALQAQETDASSSAAPSGVAPRPSNGTGGKAGVFEDQIIAVNGKERHYRLVVPETLPADSAIALVFGFHAYRGKVKAWLHEYSALDTLARDKGFIMVYPLAPIRWTLSNRKNPDIAFFDALLAKIAGRYNVDLNRVYATGMSNGAIFTHLLAAQRSDVIAAIAVHSGKLNKESKAAIRTAKRRFPVMIIHGDADPVLRVSAGRTARDFYLAQKHQIEYSELSNLGHVWGTGLGVEANIWEFFTKHPLPQHPPVQKQGHATEGTAYPRIAYSDMRSNHK